MLRTVKRRVLLACTAGALAAMTGLAAGAARAAASDFSLLILPDQGEGAIYSFINSATRSIDMTMYELRDTTVVTDLVNREKAGVQVRVILDGAQTSVNSSAFSALQAGGVGVTYSSSAFVYTHQKTISVDGAESFISTGNLDSPTTPPHVTTAPSTPTPPTSPRSGRSSTPTSRRPRSRRPTATTWSGRPPTRRPVC
jgi:hypothetical protein